MEHQIEERNVGFYLYKEQKDGARKHSKDPPIVICALQLHVGVLANMLFSSIKLIVKTFDNS